MDGYQATDRIRHDSNLFDTELRRVPIIALTASAIRGDKQRCEDVGMNDYMTKPASRDRLEQVLLKWLTFDNP
jgi:CheY-like chemotaxis protein